MPRALLPFLLVAGITAPAADAAKTTSLATQADALMAARYSADGPGAAVLVVRDGKVLFRKGYGLASVELKTPVRPDMVFRIGSMTKQFTAASILLLVEEGKVDLKAPISRYLEKTPKAWEAVTVEMLLNHTSGIPNFTDDPNYDSHSREEFAPEKFLETFIIPKPMVFQPGRDHRYNNSGFYLLGMIIEKVSGKPWDAFMKARIFEPLGMRHTRLGKETDLIPGMVQGYTEGPVPAPYIVLALTGAAGALVSNVDDLTTWTFALYGGKVLGVEGLARMLTPTTTSDGKTHPYGYGLGFRQSQGHRLIGHGGGINGFVCYMETDPTTNSMAVILNNTDSIKGADDNYYVRRLLALAAGKPIPEPRPVVLPIAQLERFVGKYRGANGPRAITLEGGTLYFNPAVGPRLELIPISATELAVKGYDVCVRFELDGTKVKGYHRREAEEAEQPLQERLEE